jgi:hypothetical protein
MRIALGCDLEVQKEIVENNFYIHVLKQENRRFKEAIHGKQIYVGSTESYLLLLIKKRSAIHFDYREQTCKFSTRCYDHESQKILQIRVSLVHIIK